MKSKIRDLIKKVIASEMKRDELVYVLGEEVAAYGGAYQCTAGLLEEFGAGRVVDTPISEMGFTGMAVGSAFQGLKPICEFMTFNFALQSIDHIINSAAKTLYMSGGRISCPIVFRGPNGFALGVGAQHTQDFSGLFCAVPGLKVVAPYTARDHVGLLRSAIRDPNPVIVLESELLYPCDMEHEESILEENFMLPLNKAIVEHEGCDVTLVGISISVGLCFKARKLLADRGISAEVINMVAINPLDIETVEASVQKTKKLLIVDCAWPECGIASEISASISSRLFKVLDRPVFTLCSKKIPTPYAEELEAAMYPTPSDIECAVNMLLSTGEYKNK
ncbi:pyruvate dehydrogenase E1 component beta subunit [Nematocida displodere]|uniref:Pyruvate dehydrogenase E1 component subunit beta n=1 Tax=Nematocida displodere TaxID=1805483 RepID=A0A177EA28_9MICR|nr:pyruvate dehydrogenase E1 component beta subunit [Nematocida displodere]